MLGGGDLSDIVTYTHPSRVFSIDLPRSWQVRDQSTMGIVQVGFSSPDEKAQLWVAINLPPDDDSDEAYSEMLNQFVRRTVGNVVGLETDEVDKDETDAIILDYYYSLNNEACEGSAYIWDEEPYAVLLSIAMPEDLWDEIEDDVYEISDSLAVEPDAPLP